MSFGEKKLDYEAIFNQGRERAFKTNEELKQKVVEYFRDGAETKREFHNGDPYDLPVLTITGLSLFLGFSSRSSFYDYVKRGEKEDATIEEQEISYTLNKARHFIENHYEKLLQSGLGTGAIFALKNFGWKDIQTLEGSLDDNGARTMKVIYEEAAHANIDENGNRIGEEKEDDSSVDE